MRYLKIVILLSMVGLLFSSCYTRLAVVQRERVYIPEEKIVHGDEVDTVYIEEEDQPYIAQYPDYGYPVYNRPHYFVNDPWYWDDFYFDLSFYGRYGNPYYWDYYWYRPFVILYPRYYYDDWYYWNGHPGRGGGHFKPRPFDRNGSAFNRGGTRIGTIRGGDNNTKYRPTRTASRKIDSGRDDASGTAIRTGADQFKPVRAVSGASTAKRKGAYSTAKRRGDTHYRATENSGRRTAKVIRDGKKAGKRVRYIVKKSKSRSRSVSTSKGSRTKSKSKNVKKNSSSGKKKSSSGSRRSSYSPSSRSSGSFSAPSRSSSSRSSGSRSSGSSSSRSGSHRSSSSKRR